MRVAIRFAGWVCLALLAVNAAGVRSLAQERGAERNRDAVQEIFELTNQARAEHRLGQLQWDDALASAAQAHAELMAQQGALSHQYPGEASLTMRVARAGARFQIVAENIALGPSASSLQTQWMNSPPHRENILDPSLNAAGVAVVRRGSQLYAVVDFSRSVASMTTKDVERHVSDLLRERGISVANGSTVDARQTCEMQKGTAGGSAPRLVMRWQSADLSKMPGSLQQAVSSGKYHSAAVGACSPAGLQSGFTAYRVAVLLY